MSGMVAVEVQQFVGFTVDRGNTVVVASATIGSGSGGGGGSGHTIEDEGTPLTARAKLNFVGGGVTATDDSGNNATIVTVPTAYYPAGTDVAVTDGGTGASTAAAARTNLVVERDFQVNVLDYGATGDGSTDDSAAIQAAIAAAKWNVLYSGKNGIVFFPMGKYYVATGLTATTSTSYGLTLVGEGVSGVDSNLASATTEIIVGNGQWGLTIGTGSSNFKGCSVRDIGFSEKNAGQALGGLRILASSNGVYERCSFGRFTAGYGIYIDGTDAATQAQYNTFYDCRVGKCLVGYEQHYANGTRWLGGYLDGANNGASVTANTIGMNLVTGDTFRSIGTCIQGWDTLVQIGADQAEFVAPRLEIWNTAAIKVLSTADGTRVGGAGDNSLHGGGSGVVVDAGATDTIIDTVIVNTATGLEYSDQGTRTKFGGNFGPAQQAATLGIVVGKRKVYQPDGTYLGELPIYDALTGVYYAGLLGQQTQNTSGNLTTVFTVGAGGIPAGDYILMSGGYILGGSSATVTIADSKSNTHTVQQHADKTTSLACHAWVSSCPVTTRLAAGDTVTVTYSVGVTEPEVNAYRYGGIVSVDAGVTATGTNLSPTASLTTTGAQDLVFASVFYPLPNSTFTPSTGFTVKHTGITSSRSLTTMTRTVPTASTVTVGATLPTTTDWALAAISFKPAASTASPVAASDVTFTPNGSIASTNVQAAIQEVRDEAGAGSGDALTTNPLSQFASTTSLQLKGVISDETGSGALVFGTSPALSTPTGIVKGDVGLGNVDNTSDATKNAASVTLTNKTLTSPAITAPTGIVKGDVGLGNVDNTADANKPVSTAQAAADALKANIASPTFTGTVTVPSGAVLGTPTSVNLSNATALADAALSTAYAGSSPVGDATHIPVLTIDTKGRITATSTATPTVADPPTVAIIARANYK